MPKQKGIVKIKGTLDDITFYQSQDGSLLRKKTSVDKDRISNDPSFLRTRENNEEFSNAANAGKLLRDTVRSLALDASDNRVTSRLTSIMMKIKTFDSTNVRGERTVANGITDPEAQELLRDFDFNIDATLSSVIFAPFSLEKSTGNITIPNFIPQSAVVAPEGATHVSLQAAFIRLDFENNDGELQSSPVQNILIDTTTTNVVLKPAAVPALPGASIYLLKVTFFQLVNGIEYALSNNNALTIVDVA